MFTGFDDEALMFFEGLEADNTKAYWLAHKDTYDARVRGAMEALLAEIGPRWGEGKPFRPYRDVRFSADKTPYKTHIGARVGDDRYVQLSADGLAAAAGMWAMARDQLARYREAVADDARGERLTAIVAALPGEVMAHDSLATAPRGYPRDHPRVELLRLKGLAAWHAWGAPDWLATPAAREHLEEFYSAAEPLVDWLHEHVGPSELPPERRR
ncbi:DUF2461 domain-containing protein [Actinotalea sp. M2MS4P-6]|uniref:DUF2461 domain-containing protein n=1 Tax=Actinotalea sp. M2MS4P-6 TaxID=2983762 RepID=UPI0021E3D726|nr:DUF2461 domain-containing protein [Actinotalea sp. M2MS4P-6]MCV2393625.1 DUF2461 domain-containing protein [Actinotalea sp. M2MS4P-6]